MNPIVILGLTKSHTVIHTLKILKKYKLAGVMVPLLSLFLILSILPPYLIAIVFVSAAVYLVLFIYRKYKPYKESQNHDEPNCTYRQSRTGP
jgi:hypothetical protein